MDPVAPFESAPGHPAGPGVLNQGRFCRPAPGHWAMSGDIFGCCGVGGSMERAERSGVLARNPQ